MPSHRSHAFNRYEIKYLLDESQIPELREELAARLGSDPHSPLGGYRVSSLYYDTADLQFYWEKIEGLKFRRKLRMRLYGDPTTCDDTTSIQVEIKQRVNRVTQKRRVELPYGIAREWLDQGQAPAMTQENQGFVDEVTRLVDTLDLRPIATTGYLREAYVGRDADSGLRVTVDHRIHGRDREFHFASGAESRYLIPPHLAVVELKADDRVPYWATDLTARLDMTVVRISKYCKSVEAFGLAPSSRYGAVQQILA